MLLNLRNSLNLRPPKCKYYTVHVHVHCMSVYHVDIMCTSTTIYHTYIHVCIHTHVRTTCTCSHIHTCTYKTLPCIKEKSNTHMNIHVHVYTCTYHSIQPNKLKLEKDLQISSRLVSWSANWLTNIDILRSGRLLLESMFKTHILRSGRLDFAPGDGVSRGPLVEKLGEQLDKPV